jgi:hypothetical protein
MIKTPTDLFSSFKKPMEVKESFIFENSFLSLKIHGNFSRIFPAVRRMNDRDWTRGESLPQDFLHGKKLRAKRKV